MTKETDISRFIPGQALSRRRLMNLSHSSSTGDLATVLSVFLIIVGGGLFTLPVVSTGDCAADDCRYAVIPRFRRSRQRYVSTPLEQEINGVENMLYMNSQATADGNLQLTITFALAPTSTSRSPRPEPRLDS